MKKERNLLWKRRKDCFLILERCEVKAVCLVQPGEDRAVGRPHCLAVLGGRLQAGGGQILYTIW